MSDIGELYQEVVIDHSKRPRNFRKIDGASRELKGYNPLCGDKLTLYLKLENDRVVDASFQGSGCAISTASASILTETVRGKTKAEAIALFERFHNLVTGKPSGDPATLGKLAVFGGVCDYPARVKCASLAWHTLKSALENNADTVTTE